MNRSKYVPLVAGTYIALPKKLQNKNAIINVQNTKDNEYLKWSLRTALFCQKNCSHNHQRLVYVKTTKCLGLTIDHFLTWRNHLQRVTLPFVAVEHLINVYRSIVESYFTNCCIFWYSIGETLADSLQKLQNRAAHVITGAYIRYGAPRSVMTFALLE